MFKIVELEQRSKDWFRFRNNKIGGSMAPVILGVSNYETPYQLWKRLISGEEIEDNSAMKYGRDKEDHVLSLFNEKNGFNFAPSVVQSEEHPILFASLDGFMGDEKKPCFLEIKCTNKKNHNLAKSGIIPPEFVPQMAHASIIMGGCDGYYVSYHDETLEVVKFVLDEYDVHSHISKMYDFYQKIETLNPPEFLERDHIPLSNEFYRLEVELLEAKKSLKDAEKRYKKAYEEVSKATEGHHYKGNIFKFTHVKRKGSVDYSKIPELENVCLDSYRKPESSYLMVTEI